MHIRLTTANMNTVPELSTYWSWHVFRRKRHSVI